MNVITRTDRTPFHVLAIIMACLLAGGCCTPEPNTFAMLQTGMTQDEVMDLLGPPSSRWNAPPPDKDAPPLPWSVRWQYGDNLSTTASTAIGREIAPDGVWVVAFNDQGKVVSFRPPLEVKPNYERQAPPK